MDLAIKIFWFVAFIVAFIAFMAFGAWLNRSRIPRDLVRGRWLLNTLLQTFLGVAFLLVSIWLLSGFWSWALTGLLMGAGLVSVLVTAVLWAFLREASNEQWGAMVFSTSFQTSMEMPLLGCLPMLFGLFLIVAYPTMMGITFFSHDLNQTDQLRRLQLEVIRYSVLYTFIAWVTTQPINIAVLMNKNLDHEGRTRQVVSLAGSMIPFALYLALALWSFGVALPSFGPKATYQAGDVQLGFDPVLVAIVFGLFGLTVLFPYFLGVYRGQRWRLALLQKRSAWLNRIIDVLVMPTAPQYRSKLEAILSDLSAEIAQLYEEEEKRNPYNLDPKQLGDTYLPLTEAYENYRPFDPRAQYLDWLRNLRAELEETIATLQQKPRDRAKEFSAARWARAFARRNGQVAATIRETRRARPVVWATGGAILWLVVSGMLGKVAEYSWGFVKETVQTTVSAPVNSQDTKPGDTKPGDT